MKLYVAIPAYGGVPVDFLQCVVRMISEPPCNMQLKFLAGDSLVSRARNSLTATFLKTDCTHLLFIDSDLIFSSEQIKRLINADKDVIGGFYPKKKEGPVEWVCNALNGNKRKPDKNGLQQVRYIGTGFLMVSRTVFEQMIVKHGAEIEYRPDHAPKETEWDLWPVGVHRAKDGFQRYLSEDWFFCQRWIEMGGKVWGDARVILKHIGTATYPLKTQVKELVELQLKAGNSSDTTAPVKPSNRRVTKPLTIA